MVHSSYRVFRTPCIPASHRRLSRLCRASGWTLEFGNGLLCTRYLVEVVNLSILYLVIRWSVVLPSLDHSSGALVTENMIVTGRWRGLRPGNFNFFKDVHCPGRTLKASAKEGSHTLPESQAGSPFVNTTTGRNGRTDEGSQAPRR